MHVGDASGLDPPIHHFRKPGQFPENIRDLQILPRLIALAVPGRVETRSMPVTGQRAGRIPISPGIYRKRTAKRGLRVGRRVWFGHYLRSLNGPDPPG